MLNTEKWGLLMLVVAACAGQPERGAKVSAMMAAEPTRESAMQFAFLPPLAEAATSFESTLSVTAPEVRLCDWTGAACAPLLAIWTTTSGPAGQTVSADLETGLHQVDWRPEQFRLERGHVYRISVLVGGTEVSHADVGLDAAGRLIDLNTGARLAAGSRAVVPIRFRLAPSPTSTTGLAQRAGSR